MTKVDVNVDVALEMFVSMRLLSSTTQNLRHFYEANQQMVLVRNKKTRHATKRTAEHEGSSHERSHKVLTRAQSSPSEADVHYSGIDPICCRISNHPTKRFPLGHTTSIVPRGVTPPQR